MNGKVTTEVYTGTARTKEQSQRRVSNLVTRMVSKEQPTDLEGRTRAQLIKARRTDLHKDRIHLRRLFFFLTFSLATTRRTIHFGYLSDLGECLGDHALTEIRRFQMAEKPPSTDNSTPFTKLESSEARNSATAPISSGPPIFPRGIRDSNILFPSSL